MNYAHLAERLTTGIRVSYPEPPYVGPPDGMGGAAFVAPGIRGMIEAIEGRQARVRFTFETAGRRGESHPLLVLEGQPCRVECRCDDVDDEQDPPLAIRCPLHDARD